MNKPPHRKPAAPGTRIGGRHRPPDPHLTGRAGACRILGISKRELRRLEDAQILVPALVKDGVRWFDIAAVYRLAVDRQAAGKKPRVRSRLARLPRGVQRVSVAQTQQILAYFAEGRSPEEITALMRKTRKTIDYHHTQWRASEPGVEPPDYFPERDLPSHAAPAGATRGLKREPRTPPASPRAPAASPPPRAGFAPVPPSQRKVTVVPASWWALPEEEEDEK